MKIKSNRIKLDIARQKLLSTKVHLVEATLHLSDTRHRLWEKKNQAIKEHQAKKQMKKIRKQVLKARGHKKWYNRQNLLPLFRHLLPLLALMFLATPEGKAQVLEELFAEDSHIDSIPTGSLRAEVDAFAFFHDNEYSSSILKGYSLPGVRIIPHLALKPLDRINIELGASMLFFNGANKYPCYAYHDIGTWKGNQYQRGSHVLPWVRLQASLKHLDIVLGNIYGGSSHRLSAPLFNAEQNLSADPEMGIQILVHRKHFESDTWLNWQSYIFETDSHQEAFTVGESMRILWGKTNRKWQWSTPLQVTIQHRGGEQDISSLGVQTLSNASVGVGIYGNPALRNVDDVSAQVSALVSYQQKGQLWAFDFGNAYHLSAGMRLMNHLNVAADFLFSPSKFASLFGNPFFSTFSLRNPGITYNGNQVLRLALGYQYTFAQNYTLGANAEFFNQRSTADESHPKLSENNFSFGLYFRVSPTILIKKL